MAAKLETTRHPGIYRRGSRYVVIWRHKGRQRQTSYGTLAEAREAKGRADAGESRPASRERFHDYAEQWLQTYQGRTVRGVGSRTMSGYRRCLELYALPYFQGYKLAEIEPPDAREFVRHLEGKGLRPSTTRGVLAPLRAMFATAVEDGALRQNPTIGVRVSGRRDAPPGREVRALTRTELADLLEQLPEEWRLFFELLAHSGLRISEAIGLTWDHVEFGNRPRLLVRQQDCSGQVGELKSDYSRRDVPLAPGMARRLWAAQGQPRARVFTTITGTPLSDGNVRRRVLEPARAQQVSSGSRSTASGKPAPRCCSPLEIPGQHS